MASITELVSKVRLELNDQPKQFTKTVAGDGSTTSFSLGVKPLDLVTLLVTVDNAVQAQGVDFTVEAAFGVIHFSTAAPALNSVVKVTGNVYRYFSDADIEYFVNTAVTQHTFNRTDQFGRVMTIAAIPEVEVYPLTILSTVEALYALATDASFDINIFAPDGVTIPRSERYHQLTGLINQRMEQYRSLCAQLNIGLFRIEVGVLRRTSKLTNKLVPIFVPQEIDDARRPERVFLPIDITGRTPIPSTVPIYDIVLQQGDSWEVFLDFPDATDFDDLNFKAEVRTYPGSPSLWATINIEIFDAVEKKLRLSLTKEQTKRIPLRAFWDLQATSDYESTYQRTFLRGQVFCEREVTQGDYQGD